MLFVSLVGWLVDWLVSCLVGWWSFGVKGFWALWDNIYE
jgi:hypothetical protein